MPLTQRNGEAAPSTGAEVGPWERGQLTAVLNSQVHARHSSGGSCEGYGVHLEKLGGSQFWSREVDSRKKFRRRNALGI